MQAFPESEFENTVNIHTNACIIISQYLLCYGFHARVCTGGNNKRGMKVNAHYSKSRTLKKMK